MVNHEGATPTAQIAANAKRGLELRARFKRGGTEVGVARAHQLAARDPLNAADIKSMYSYFARHEVDKLARARIWGDESNPSAGYIAWMLWGGDEGKAWAARQHAALAED
ncbi:MAG: hypothetical protein JWM38_414 [Sphingomonas bacterium]|jgi:hypothetical protein|nr:hypothetical protein [Sphingomonas bacterium]MDB5716987.1 hypothetical protein [Sphingomonas bacterium]